jgi:phosphatidylglycerol:prolipoprotein diacylglycerol transferase
VFNLQSSNYNLKSVICNLKFHAEKTQNLLLATQGGGIDTSPSIIKEGKPGWRKGRFSCYNYFLMLPILFRIGSIEIASYGITLALGIILAWGFFSRQLRDEMKPELLINLVTVAIIAGLIGARINFILEHFGQIESFGEFLSMLFSRSGLTAYGGLLAGTFAAYLYSRKHDLPTWKILDAGSFAICIGYFFGRLGCQLAGDGDYGVPTDLPWGMSYPQGTVPTFEKVHPVPVYEMLIISAIFLILWRLKQHRPPDGFLFSGFLVLFGVERFLMEFIRFNPRIFYGLTEVQLVSAAMVLSGLYLLSRLRSIKNVETLHAAK